MPIPTDNKINAGEILLQELCNYFNEEVGYKIITDILNIHADVKLELLKFIDKKTGKSNFQPRALDRLIEKAKNKKLLGIIPSKNASLCTICFVVLKKINPKLQFRSQVSHGEIHGQSFYSVDFTKEFIQPLLISKSNLTSIPSNFLNSCWYLYINVVDKKTAIRKTGRKILKFSEMGDGSVKVEYFPTNPTIPDWTGTASYNSFKRRLVIRLKTPKNIKRNMLIDFHISNISSPPIIKAYISYTSMREMDKEIQTKIFLVKADCNTDLLIDEFFEGQDPSIKEIEDMLKLVKLKHVLHSSTCHDCDDSGST